MTPSPAPLSAHGAAGLCRTRHCYRGTKEGRRAVTQKSGVTWQGMEIPGRCISMNGSKNTRKNRCRGFPSLVTVVKLPLVKS
eukprot:2537418-Rhodomonas_salina.1